MGQICYALVSLVGAQGVRVSGGWLGNGQGCLKEQWREILDVPLLYFLKHFPIGLPDSTLKKPF
jgi:hypothetical protein